MCRGVTFILATWILHAQPLIYYRVGVSNAASSLAPGLPAGSIAQGSTFSVYGRGIGPSISPALAFPLQSTLGGVSIAVTQGQTVVHAIPVFVGPGQVNAIMPSNAPLGMVSLRVTFNGVQSNPAPVRVVSSSFGIFTVFSTGIGPAIAQNFISASQQPVDSLQSPAQAGQYVTLWGTGLGPSNFPDNVAPTVVNLGIQTEVFVGGKPAAVTYHGRSPCCAGIDVVNFQVPPGAPAGCWVPVYVRTAGTIVSNFATMAIGNGGPCKESTNALPSALINGGKIGSLLVARVAVHDDVGVDTTTDVTSDMAAAFIGQEKQGPFNFNPLFSLSPAGTCTAYTASDGIGMLPETSPTVGPLDAGSLSAGATGGTVPFASTPFGPLQQALLGGDVSSIPALRDTLVLNSGRAEITATGGSNVGAFQTSGGLPPQPLTWTNRDQLSLVVRNQPLTLTWTGGTSTVPVIAAGGGMDLPTNSTSFFVCVASPGASSITVPADVLANIPASRQNLLQSLGVLYLGQWNVNGPAGFTASGLNTGIVTAAGFSGKSVAFQ